MTLNLVALAAGFSGGWYLAWRLLHRGRKRGKR
jgi:hypothetical protein